MTSRGLRGAWNRRGPLSTLAAMTTVVVAGTVTVIAVAAATGTSALVLAPLLLLGAVAVPAIGAEVAEARREEIGLARLRGIRRLPLLRMIALEPLGAVLVGLGVGGALGTVAAHTLAQAWDPGADVTLGAAWAAASGVALGGLLIVLVGALRALAEPLAGQLRSRVRPGANGPLGTFAALLVLVGAAVSVQRSRVQASGEPDLLVQLAPALLGLACALVASWILGRAARAAVVATRSATFAPFLAARRLARSGELLPGVRLVVAAGVVSGLALGASAGVSGWLDEQARVTAGAVWGVTAPEMEADALVALTHELDPAGKHLMAAVVVPAPERLGERRAYLDARRFDAVSGSFLADTRADTRAEVGGLAGERLADWTFQDTVLRIGASTAVPDPAAAAAQQPSIDVDLVVSYLTLSGDSGEARTGLRLPARGDRRAVSLPVPECAEGCRMVSVAVSRSQPPQWWRPVDARDAALSIDTLVAGGRNFAAQEWWSAADLDRVEREDAEPAAPDQSAPDQSESDQPESAVSGVPDGMLLRLQSSGALEVFPGAVRLPILVTGADPDVVADPASRARAGEVRGSAAALPLLGSRGYLADLEAASVGSRLRMPKSQAWVLAAADTPRDLLDAVAARTDGEARRWEDVESDLALTSGAATSVTSGVTALASALVALLALVAAATRSAARQRREIASFRLLGVDVASVRRAGAIEVAGLAAVAAAFVALGALLAVRTLLDGEALVSLAPAALAPDPAAGMSSWLVPTLVVLFAVLGTGAGARRVHPAMTAPAVLREEESR